ncbi:PREDICTED: cadherin-related family member 1-like, partial [Priapulus caudatus]|uniref:Cadherin-related family member 1-like n=1 Tax=Priapulus caudatus TaxID=37621 RepID=A0ABM1F451_PRICU
MPGVNAVFEISLTGGAGVFAVAPRVATGSTSVSIRVVNASALDYERLQDPVIELQVTARERSTPQHLSSVAVVTVTVEDRNDNAPVFSQPSYDVSIPENVLGGATVVVAAATDADSGDFGTRGIRYRLFGNGAERFVVDEVTGVVEVATCDTPGSGNCLDYDAGSATYQLFVAAADEAGGGRSTVAPLTVRLTDVNDNRASFAEGYRNYTAIVDEGSTQFNPPLIVQAEDADGSASISYSIVSGNTNDVLSIDNVTGVVSVAAPEKLDISLLATDLVVLTVAATDGGGSLPDLATVSVFVREVNDRRPTFDPAVYAASVRETDPPGTLTSSADPEVSAVDGGVPPQSGTATVVVSVLDANNRRPTFQPAVMRVDVPE